MAHDRWGEAVASLPICARRIRTSFSLHLLTAFRRSNHVVPQGVCFRAFNDSSCLVWLMGCGLPSVVSSGQKRRVVMYSGDDFVTGVRAPSLATDTKNDRWFEVAHRRVYRHIAVVFGTLGARWWIHQVHAGAR
jgi:hypothetical protein